MNMMDMMDMMVNSGKIFFFKTINFIHYSLKNLPDLKKELKQKMIRLLNIIDEHQGAQANNQQVKIIDQQYIKVDRKKFSETYMIKNLLK